MHEREEHGREDELFNRFKRTGDAAALGEVYDLVASELFGVAVHLTKSPAAAEDLLQSTFVAAIEKAQTFDSRRRVMPWLTGILANQARTARFEQGRSPDPQRLVNTESTDPANAPSPDESALESELAEKLDEALARVPVAFRPVLVLRLKHGLVPAEIAHALGRPPATVRTQLARGLESLRRALPASFAGAGALVLAGSARGLDTVREAVVAHAVALQAPLLSLPILTGVLAMKKSLLAAGCVIAALTVWSLVPADEPLEFEELDPVAAQETVLAAIDENEAVESVRAPASRVEDEPVQQTSSSPEPLPDEEPDDRGTGTLEVLVSWAEPSSPAAGVLVKVRTKTMGSSYGDHSTATTNENGLVRFEDFPVGWCWVKPQRGDGKNTTVRSDKTRRVELVISAGVTVDGAVVDETGAPVPEAEIWLSNDHDPHHGHVVDRADRAGRFELKSIKPDVHYVAARGAGFAPSSVRKLGGTVGGRASVQLVLDRPAAAVRGIVRDRDGDPIAGARVLVGAEVPPMSDRTADGLFLHGPPAVHAISDERGEFVCESAPLGLQPISARARGYAPARVEFDLLATGENMIDMILDAESVLEGIVRSEEGKPLGSVLIRTQGKDPFATTVVNTDPEGVFRLRGLPAERVEISADHKEYGGTETFIELAPGETGRWDPVLKRAPRVFGHLYGPDGEPLTALGVTIREDRGDRSFFLTSGTDPRGAFSIPDAIPKVAYTLLVQHPKGYSRFPLVTLEDVKAGHEPIEIHVTEEQWRTGRVVGDVVGPDGEPVANVRVTVWHIEKEMWRSFEVSSETGQFEIDGVPPGTCSFEVRAQDYPWVKLGERTVETGEVLDLGTTHLVAPSTLAGSILGATDEQLASLQLSLAGPGGEAGVITLTGASYESSALAPGEYSLTVRGDRVRYTRLEVTIREGAGNTKDVVIETVPMRIVNIRCPDDVELPRFSSCRAFDANGKFAWHGNGTAVGDREMELRVSAPAGTYRLEGTTSSDLTITGTLEILGAEQPPAQLTFGQGD